MEKRLNTFKETIVEKPQSHMNINKLIVEHREKREEKKEESRKKRNERREKKEKTEEKKKRERGKEKNKPRLLGPVITCIEFLINIRISEYHKYTYNHGLLETRTGNFNITVKQAITFEDL